MSSLATTVVVGLAVGASLSTYLSAIVVPALPWLLDLVDTSRLHAQASVERRQIEIDLNAQWQTGASLDPPEIATATLRENQSRIFVNRLTFGRVPTWIYRIYRMRNQAAFTAAAEAMLAEKGWDG